jgi:hypothetical protein
MYIMNSEQICSINHVSLVEHNLRVDCIFPANTQIPLLPVAISSPPHAPQMVFDFTTNSL